MTLIKVSSSFYSVFKGTFGEWRECIDILDANEDLPLFSMYVEPVPFTDGSLYYIYLSDELIDKIKETKPELLENWND